MREPATIEALIFRHEQLRYLASRVVHTAARPFWSARLPPLYHTRLPRPVPSHPGWCRIDVSLSGICGSDLAMLTGAESLYLEPEASYPFVPGHEVTGTVGAGSLSGTARIEPGQRVAVWPVLGCAVRGASQPCGACRAGWIGLCSKRDGHWPGPGLAIGFNRETGGGWSASCLAHESQLWPLPDAISDEDAVLLDPAASSLAALLRTGERGAERTLIVGGGTIGLLAGYLHRALGLAGTVEVLVRHDFQLSWVTGRDVPGSVVRDDRAFRDWAANRGMPSRRVLGYGHVFQGTYDRVVVAAGTASALRWAIQSARPRGTVVLMTAPPMSRVDLTPLWYREVSVRGVYVYGPVPWGGEERHPYEVLIPRLADRRLDWRDMVTHTFLLSQYHEALSRMVRRGEPDGGVIKAAFRPGDA
ncbi:MAG TPA: alcohol dehydrogenase catalytic domain-containing protein [Gemmatimonadales bacterium]|nr:alcohol dehydrogenase catalytic domain-containing protein [Gemmatimonadales bacterium]